MKLTAPLAALVAAFLFGASTPLVAPFARTSSPQLLAGLLYAGSGIALGAWIALSRLPRSRMRVPASERAPLIGAVICGGVLGPLLLMSGLRSVQPHTASLLLNLEIVFTACLAWWLFHENAGRRVVIAMALILAGAVTLIAPEAGAADASWLGITAIVGACLAWAIDNNLTRNVNTPAPAVVACIKGIAAATINIGMAVCLGVRWPPAGTMSMLLVIGAVGYGLSLVLFIRAQRTLGTARTSAYFATAPFIGAALALALVPSWPSAFFLLAGAMLASGVWLHLTEVHDHVHSHGSLVHSHPHTPDADHRHH